MFKAVVCAALCAAAAPAGASELLWQGTHPSGTVMQGPQMAPAGYCYPTVRRLNGKLYYHRSECQGSPRNHLDIGVPLTGSIVNMRGIHQATRMRYRTDGMLELY